MFLNREKTKKVRRKRGITCAQVAEYLNYRSENDYYYRECGSVPISEVDLAILAKLLGVPGDTLINTNI